MCELWHIRCTECTREYTDRKKLASCESDDPADKCPPHLCMEIGTSRKPIKAECEDCKNLREMAESLAEGHPSMGADVRVSGDEHVGAAAHVSGEQNSNGIPCGQVGGERIAGRLEGALPPPQENSGYYQGLRLDLDEEVMKVFASEGRLLGKTVGGYDQREGNIDQLRTAGLDQSKRDRPPIPRETDHTVGRVDVDHRTSASFCEKTEDVDLDSMEPQFTDEVIEQIYQGGYL